MTMTDAFSVAVTRRQISEGMGRILESMIQQNPNGTLGLALPTIPIKTIAAGKDNDSRAICNTLTCLC